MVLRLCTLVGLLWLVAGAPAAQAQDVQALRGRRVLTVNVEGEGLSAAEGLQYVEVHPGDRFSINAVRRSVKLLYYLGLFGQVRALAVPRDEGVDLTFQLVPKRTVLAVGFFGNDVLDDTDLKRLSRLERGDEYDQWKMEASAVDILQLYRKRGYRRTQIISKAEGKPEGDVNVRYYIQEGQPTRISRIWFKGKSPYSPQRMSRVMELDRGDVLDEQTLKKGLDQLRSFFRKEKYLEVRIVEPKPDYQLAASWEVVPIEIQAGPRITFRFEGNQVIKQKALLEAIQVEKEVEYNPFLLEDLAERVEDLYHRNGFSRAQVAHQVFWNEARTRKEIVFLIEEGHRVTVREIRFEGNQAFGDSELKDYIYNAMLDEIPQDLVNQPVDRGDLDQLGGSHPLSGPERRVNRPQGFLTELVPETVFLREPYEKALGQISDLYHASGYLDALVEPPVLSYDASGSSLYISIPIVEGQKTLVESISFEGNQSFSSTRLFEVADRLTGLVRPGQALNLYGVEQLRRELVNTYAKEGYYYCRVEHRIGFSEDRSLGEVVYVFNEGPQVQVGRVLVRGDVVTDPAVFDHTVTIRPGEIFTPDKVTASQKSLYSLGVFNGVDIKVLDPEVVAPEKDVVVTVRERLPHSIEVSPGISSAEGVRVQLDYIHRNLFGYAMEFMGRAKVNYLVFYPLYPDWELRYQEMSFFEGLEGLVLTGLHWPKVWLLDMDMAARLDLFVIRDHAISHDLTKVSLVPGVDMTLAEDLVLTLEFELEFDELGCIQGECGGPTQKYLRYDEGSLLLGVLRPKLSWDLRDNIFRPHKGALITFLTELANNFLTDREVLYLKLDASATGYIPLARDVTLALSLRTGFIFNLTDGSKTPSHKLFWKGGRNSIRGFTEEGLIPADQRDPDNPSSPCVPKASESDELRCISLGGNAYVSLKGELRFPLIPGTLEGAVFADLGNLWVQPLAVNPLILRPTAGFGIRIVTPVGPMAFDFGFNLDPDESRGENIWNLHFNIGVF
jgi:outer membrane protein insertion porin family